MASTVFVRFSQEGFHHWPEATGKRAYLRDRHRHLFVIEAECEVEGEGREVEFHDLRDQVEILYGLLAGPERDFGGSSCETIARKLGEHLTEAFQREFLVSVSEDRECGARVRVGERGQSNANI